MNHFAKGIATGAAICAVIGIATIPNLKPRNKKALKKGTVKAIRAMNSYITSKW